MKSQTASPPRMPDGSLRAEIRKAVVTNGLRHKRLADNNIIRMIDDELPVGTIVYVITKEEWENIHE